MLGGHRIDDLRESFVGGPHAMAPCKQVAFEPSLAEMLAQYLHHAAVRTQFIVDRNNLSHRAAFGGLEDGVKTIGIRFIGTEHAKVRRIHFEDVPEEISQFTRCLGKNLTRSGDIQCIICEVRQSERDQLPPTIHMGIASHAPIPNRRESRQLIDELAIFVEEFLWLIALHPGFKNLEMLGVFTHRSERDLVSPESAFDRNSIHFLGTGPSLGPVPRKWMEFRS